MWFVRWLNIALENTYEALCTEVDNEMQTIAKNSFIS